MRAFASRDSKLLSMPSHARRASSFRSGQAMIESLLAIGLICLIFFGAMQISQMYAARAILYHAAARGARAKTVGFNQLMVRKVIYVGSIPNAGAMLTPQMNANDPAIANAIAASKASGKRIDPWIAIMSGSLIPSSEKYQIEHARIPEFLGAENMNSAGAILNYAAWQNNQINFNVAGVPIGGVENAPPLEVTVSMHYTNWLPMSGTFYSGNAVQIEGRNILENHYSVYIDDQHW